MHRVIKLNWEAWLKPYIDMNTAEKKCKKWFQKEFSSSWWITVFGKTMENVRNHRDIKLITTESRRNYLMSEPNCHTNEI